MASESDEIKSDLIEDKELITNLVKLQDKRLSYVSQNGKSIVWQRFKRIYYENNETIFVKCKYCDNVQKNMAKSGTCGLLKHKCQTIIDNMSEAYDHNIDYSLDTNYDTSLVECDERDHYFDDDLTRKPINELMITENEELLPINDRQHLIDLFKSRDSKLSFIPQKGKSDAWNRFERIFYEELPTLYVKCKYCDDILKNKKRGGTAGLLRHKCNADGVESCYGFNDNNNNENTSNNSRELCTLFTDSEMQLFDDKNYLKELIQSEDRRLIFASKKGKSEVWNRFKRIYLNNFETSYVKCNYCDDIQKNTANGGTSGLLKHTCQQMIDSCQLINYDLNRDCSRDEDQESNVSELSDGLDATIDKTFIKTILESEDSEKLTYSSQNGKSEVWNRFERIIYDNRKTVYVKCKFCDYIQKHIKGTGTCSLLKHKCQQYLDYHQLEETLNFNISRDCNRDEDKDSVISCLDGEQNVLTDKNLIRNLIETKDNKLSFVSQTGKSDAWNRFQRILYENTKTIFVKCKYCDDIQKHTSGSGTCGLLKHKCKIDRKLKSEENRSDSVIKIRNRVIDEKLLIKRLSHENKSLRSIVEKCLKIIDNCLCINKYNTTERRDINTLINEYNNSNKIITNFTKNDNEFSDESDNERVGETDDLNVERKREYNYNSNKTINRLRLIGNSNKQRLTNAIKRKYIRSKRKPKELLTCEWPGCERVFKNSQQFKDHKDRHLEVKHFFCDWPGCEDGFLKKPQLMAHICKYHTNDMPFKCDQCSYSSPYKAQYLSHRLRHTNDKPCVCDWPGCEFKTKFAQGLAVHKMRHSGVKPYKCSWPSCEWSFRQRHHLKAHMLKHTGEKPVMCDSKRCDRRFTSRQAMKAHYDKVHQNFCLT